MPNIVLPEADYDFSVRRARVEAKRLLRNHEREFGRYCARHVIHDIRMAGWLAERMRQEASELSDAHLASMRAQMFRKLALAELVVTNLQSNPSAADAGSS